MANTKTVFVNTNKVQAIAKERSWSLASVCRMLGTYTQRFSNVKVGKNLFTDEETAKLCEVLNCNPSDILDLAEDIAKVSAILSIKKDPIAYDEVELDIINDLFSKLTKSNQSLIETMARELLLRQEAETKSPEE